MRKWLLLTWFVFFPLIADAETPGFDPPLGGPVPLDIAFRDEANRDLPLAAYFGRGPVALVLAYYGCPNLCSELLEGVAEGLRESGFAAGRDYQLLVVSIHPWERPSLARERKAAYLARHPLAPQGVHFLTGAPESIERLARAAGFRYRYDPPSGEFEHPAGFLLVTESGRLSRYFAGVRFAPGDIRMGLTEASGGRVSGFADRLRLLCYHYDPQTGRYTVAVMQVLAALALVTVLVLAIAVVRWLRSERRRAGPGVP